MNTETKHTPGPWHSHLRNVHQYEIVDDPDCPTQIAIVPTKAEAEANACLIAAAPELLDALNYGRSMAILNPPAGISEELWGTFWEKVETAIEKAEGGNR